jgi:hypothetical protein
MDNAYNCKICISERTVTKMSTENSMSPMWHESVTVRQSHLLFSTSIALKLHRAS